MSWKYVFNTRLAPNGYHGTIDDCRERAHQSCYKFFEWNFEVYVVTNGGKSHEMAGIKITEVF